MNKIYDVAIVGGGVVGLTFALALARSNFKVIVIEKNYPPDHSDANKDFRVSAINLASHAIFKSLDVWLSLSLRAGVFEQIRVFEASYGFREQVTGRRPEGGECLQKDTLAYELHFDSALIQKPFLGVILSHVAMSKALLEALSEYPVEICYESEVESIQQESEKNILTLKSGEKIFSQLVVGADGKNSRLRELLGISVKEKDYQQTALVAQVYTEKSHQKTAWQCFLPEGPLAFLPLPDENSCSIVWSTSSERATELKNLSDDKFAHELENAFEKRLGSVQLQGSRFTFPLKMRYALPFVKPGCALIGDAVHTIHPLAGQGLNLGLLDAVCLAQVLQEAREKLISINDFSVLRRYERWRKTQHLSFITAMDVFKKSFSFSSSVFSNIRKKVMLQVNKSSLFKRICMQYATGVSGDLPKICGCQD